jgi:hypothetical protein
MRNRDPHQALILSLVVPYIVGQGTDSAHIFALWQREILNDPRELNDDSA